MTDEAPCVPPPDRPPAAAGNLPVAAGAAISAPGSLVRLTVVVVGLVLLTLGHVLVPPAEHEVHALLFNAGFLPLILAGLWFQVRGALIASVLTSAMSLAHLFGQLAPDHAPGHWSTVGLVLLYNVVAVTTGALSQRRNQAVARAEAHARAVEANARALLQAEESMARSERLRSLGELSAGLAHEIRNPLGGIRGAAEVLAKSGTPPEAREEFARLMEDEVVRLDRVVRNFLQFARPGTAGVARVRPAEVVDAVFLLVRSDARHQGIVLENAVPEELVLRADADRLRQILLNLVMNAVQAQDAGGRVRVAAGREGEVARIDVVDSGSGVPDAIRGRIFDPFVTTRAEGSGLGLAIAHRLAASMNGSVELASTGPSGSVFRLTLPRAPIDFDVEVDLRGTSPASQVPGRALGVE